MSSANAFCEVPISERDWFDNQAPQDAHWYDFEPVAFFPSSGHKHSQSAPPIVLNVEQAFSTLAEQWDSETAYLSSIHSMVLHPAYQRIIGLGPAVLPFLLRDLRETGRFWFWALAAITGQNPVPDEAVGDIPKMTQFWVDWGRRQGLLE